MDAELPANLPQIIRPHPFHPEHTLVLEYNSSQRNCSTCTRKKYSSSVYRCDQSDCPFVICWKCSTLKPTLVYRGHEHNLCFTEKMEEDLVCDADTCNFRQSQLALDDPELDGNTYSYIFRCVPCNFNIVHLLCGPLPNTVKYKYHIHPLVLFEDLVIEDESGEYYCDVCEGQRDPKFRVYYCEACKYVAHVRCLIKELTGMLTEIDIKPDASTETERDRVEGTTLKDILNRLSTEDRERFEEHFDWNTPEIGHSVTPSPDQDQYIPEKHFFPRSELDFCRLLHRFDKYCNFRRLKLESNDLKVRLYKVENYMVGWNLSFDLARFLKRYGDVSNGSELTLNMKNIAFHFLCKVINEMRGTLVNYVNEKHLRDWYGYLKFVTRMGFRIDFVYLNLEKIKHAFFDLRAKNLERGIPNRLDQQKFELQKQIAKIDDELQNFEEYRNAYQNWKIGSESFLDVGSKMLWNTADESLSRRYN